MTRPTIVYRNFGQWTDPVTDERRSAGIFSGKVSVGNGQKTTRPVPYFRTEQDLAREAEMLQAREVVVELDARPDQLRVDGHGPKAGARIDFPGVVVRLIGTPHGDLRWACDAFDSMWSEDMPGWQANVRAVAKSLEALRVPERYGIGSRGEQYVGWAAIGAGTPMGAAATPEPMTLDRAAAVLAGAGDSFTPAEVLADPDDAKAAYRVAAKRYHPDTGGSVQTFQQVEEAWRLVSAHHG